MRRIIAMLLCVILCVNMIVVASSRGEPIEDEEYVFPTVTLDGFEFSIFPGYYNSFVAKHIKIGLTTGNVYAFKDWSVEGVEIDDTTSLNLYFIMPDNDIVLTPNYYLLGNVDKDEDETITAFDIMALANGIKNGNSEKELDVNLDGTVAATDIITLSQFIKGSFDVTELYYTVNVEGKDVVKYDRLASDFGTVEVPLVPILEAYGAVVEWESDTVATITYKGDRYLLNIADFYLWKLSDKNEVIDASYFLPLPGGTLTHTMDMKTIYIEHGHVQHIVSSIINNRIIINYDLEKRIVNVIDNPNF